ncbi:MAG: glycoside hydrolase family 13 protein [Eubacteriales bacterium]|nr:glycoside hydrolase family 13 protein [Eubacteriales bacterium]
MAIGIPGTVFKSLSHAEKFQLHINNTKPILNFAALFSDGGEYYFTPMEPKAGERVKIRLRTAKDNVDHVFVVLNNERVEMEVGSSNKLFDYYECETIMPEDFLEYYFEIVSAGAICYFNKKGPIRHLEPFFNYKVKTGFSTPEWAKGAIFYQILVDRFANGDPTNDVVDNEYIYIDEKVNKVTDWGKYPAQMGVREFYGGDLQGVYDKLDYLQDLGVDVIYFNPIFVSPSNHKYDTQDYDYIDPHYGKIVVDGGKALPDDAKDNVKASKYISRVTDKRNLEASNTFFIELVEEIHRRGMKVVLDGVFNHCGSFNKWMDAERIYENQKGYEKGAFVDAKSPYRKFFKFYDTEAWPYNEEYDGWWGHKTLPKLNYEESDKLYNYILEIGKKWVSPPFNCDGWRLDVAADLGQTSEMNHRFWKDFRKAVKEANPNAIILAEHYGDCGDWLQGDEWDTIMNYSAFMEPVTWFLTGLEKHSDEKRSDLLGNTQAFRDAMIYHMSRFQYPSMISSMNELSNHDHSRFLTRTNMTVGRTNSLGPEAADKNTKMSIMRAGVLMQMTWPGAPTIYYGDEAGVTGWTDPDNRRTYPWGKEDKELIQYHKDLIKIHKKETALMKGSLMYLRGGENVVCYSRFTDDEKMIVAVNASSEPRNLTIAAWEAGVTDQEMLERVVKTDENGYTLSPKTYDVNHGMVNLTMPANGAILFKAVPKKVLKKRRNKVKLVFIKDVKKTGLKRENTCFFLRFPI